MPLDPITWAVGFAANKGAAALLAKVFDVGAYGEIHAAASKWSAGLPADIRTPAEALFQIDSQARSEASPYRSKLKKAILDLHQIPSEHEWYEALIESWHVKRCELGAEGNAFFQLEPSVAELHLRQLAAALFASCASIIKYSQPLIVRELREVGITQALILKEMKAFRSPLNNFSPERNEPITLNVDPTHIEETQLHKLNEVACVDSPSEVIAGSYRTHVIWLGPEGCSKDDASFVPIEPQYVAPRLKLLLDQWNRLAVDLAKLETKQVISALSSFHHRFLSIHPYPDGNGRVARALLDLQIQNFTPARSPLRLKAHNEYYLALRAADEGDLSHLIILITRLLKEKLGEWD